MTETNRHRHRGRTGLRTRPHRRARRRAAGTVSPAPATRTGCAPPPPACPACARCPATSPTPPFRAALVAAAGGRLDLLVHNAGELGPSPLPPLAAYPADALRAVLETTLLAPLRAHPARAARCCAPPRAGTVVTLSSDAAVEAYPGWGGYGAAKAALDQLAAVLGVEEPDAAASTRSTRATCARPCTSARSRARTSPTGPMPETSCPRSCGCSTSGRRQRPATAPPTAGRCGCVSPRRPPRSPCRPSCRPPDPPEARGLARDGVRLLVAAAGTPAATPAFRRPPGRAAPGRPGRRQRPPTPSPPPSTAAGPTAGRWCCTCRGRCPRGGQEVVVELRDAGRAPDRRRRGRRAVRLPGGVDGVPAWPAIRTPAVRARQPALAGPDPGRRRAVRAGCARSAGRSATPTCADAGRLGGLPHLFARRPSGGFASAEMPSAARPFTPAVLAGLRARGVGVAPLRCTPGSSSLEAGEVPLPERYAVPASTAAAVNTARAAGGRVVAVGTTVTRALETVADPRPAGCAPAPAGPTWCSARTARPGSSTGLVTGWHEPAGVAPAAARGGRRAAAGRAGLRGRGRPGLPLARVRRLLRVVAVLPGAAGRSVTGVLAFGHLVAATLVGRRVAARHAQERAGRVAVDRSRRRAKAPDEPARCTFTPGGSAG